LYIHIKRKKENTVIHI